MSKVSLDFPLITAAVDLTDPLTPESLLDADMGVRQALAEQLAPERVGDMLTLTVLVLSPVQAQALATYVRHISAELRRFLNPEARALLDALFGSQG